ncbi:hypothetical protein BJF79_24135 [Actinomadura sp. CNU-125]|uniref:hypothetical protein n=1 Tax=Actinomadura sp. CNU-125 TaxID=1904961 RepID=UPI00095C89C2|nr:hypothetical protein [Actinomadura sp. CNU-125]OLT11421.1 hypothetical protein BJF79_24135 [Actinomadura sp. CNU-125]
MAGQRRVLHVTAWIAAFSGLLITPARAAAAPEWTSTPVPALQGLVVPTEVAAAGPHAVWTSGVEDATSSGTAFMLAWDGRGWRRQELPAPESTTIMDIAASGPRSAWAIGSKQTEEGGYRPVALHWDGTAWREVGYPDGVSPTIPLPSPSWQLEIASAAPDAPAWSIGYDEAAGESVALRFERGRWVRQNLPVKMDKALTVAVRSSRDVWIACICELPGEGPTQVMLHWDGVRWNTVRLPSSDDTQVLEIVPVSSSSVWAYRAGAGTNYPAVPDLLHWDGTDWSSTPIPVDTRAVHFPNLADDGRGGALVAANTVDGDTNYLHYGDGEWTTESGPGRPGVGAWIYDIARVPGTRTIWSVGLVSPLSGPALVERRR